MREGKENLLLAALLREERERLDPFLEWVGVEFQEILIEPDELVAVVESLSLRRGNPASSLSMTSGCTS